MGINGSLYAGGHSDKGPSVEFGYHAIGWGGCYVSKHNMDRDWLLIWWGRY